MRWKGTPARSETAPRQQWPEKVDRKVLALVLAVVLVGTPITSLTVFSKHIDDEVFDIEPGSYHAIHFGFYGPAKLQHSERLIMGFEVRLLEMDRLNFERFKAGDDYERSGSMTVTSGSLDTGYEMMFGPMWELFLVFVNEGAAPARVELRADSTVYFSLAATLLLVGGLAVVGYVVMRRSPHQGPRPTTVMPPQGKWSERRKAVAVIGGILLLSVAVTVALGRLLPPDFALHVFDVTRRISIGAAAGVVASFVLRMRLQVTKSKPEYVLAILARRLRVSGYMVTERSGKLTVQVSSTSAVKVSAKEGAGGTLVSYCADATPSGWTLVVILLLFLPLASPVSMAFALFLIYRSAVFASDRILPRLSSIDDGSTSATDEAHMMLVECLSEGRRLSSEAYESARSHYQDAIILLGTVNFLLSTILVLYSGLVILEDLEPRMVWGISLLLGVAVWTASTALLWFLLARRSKPRMKELWAWTSRLEIRLRNEVAMIPPKDGEPSTFELVAESYKQIPNWLRVRRKGGMYREPVQWVVIVFSAFYTVIMALAGAMDLARGHHDTAAIILAVSAAFGGLAVFMYMNWRVQRSKEDAQTVKAMTTRFETLKAEMEAYIGSV